MMRRLMVIVVVGVFVAALFQLDDPHAAPRVAASPVVGSVYDPGSTATTWYCAAAPDADGDIAHQIVITNPGNAATARITGYGTATGSGVSSVVDVPAESQHVVSVKDIGPSLGGATVEVTGAAVTVAHRIVGPNVEDQSNCLTEASDRWYFAAADTELDRATETEAAAHLWLLNPFPTDASVDIRVTTDDSVRVAPALSGIIVPAGSARMVDLGATVKRRPQFAFAVEARGGRVVAELAQTVGGQGLRLQPGASRGAATILFADSFGGPELAERVVVYNPSTEDTTVSVSVIPDGFDPSAFPEPFVLDIPGRRFGSVDLTAEARVPLDSMRWIRVDAVEGPGVVASQVMAVTGPGGDGTAATRPSVAGGLASSPGTSAAATSWYLTSLSPTPDSLPVVVIANPSPDNIAVVDLARIAGGGSSPIAADLEVPPLGLRIVDVGEATPDGPIGVVVTASAPVVVSGRTTSLSRSDLAMVPALPDTTTVTPFGPLAGG